METEYKIILAGYAFNWLLSIPMYNRWVRFDGLLGLWMIAWQITLITCLVKVGDVDWKHGILLAFAILALIGAVTSASSGKPVKMSAGTFWFALLMAPVYFWLLFS